MTTLHELFNGCATENDWHLHPTTESELLAAIVDRLEPADQPSVFDELQIRTNDLTMERDAALANSERLTAERDIHRRYLDDALRVLNELRGRLAAR
jgi:hypothetical protein